MRDGIHRKLPLGVTWRRLMRRCNFEAHFGDSVDEAAYKAVRHDVDQAVTRRFLVKLDLHLSKVDLLTGTQSLDLRRPEELGGSGSTAEIRIIELCRLAAPDERTQPGFVQQVLSQVIGEQVAAQADNMANHWLIHARGQAWARQGIEECKRALSHELVQRVTQDFLSRSKDGLPSSAAPTDVDDSVI